jgi:hypothetical protein
LASLIGRSWGMGQSWSRWDGSAGRIRAVGAVPWPGARGKRGLFGRQALREARADGELAVRKCAVPLGERPNGRRGLVGERAVGQARETAGRRDVGASGDAPGGGEVWYTKHTRV